MAFRRSIPVSMPISCSMWITSSVATLPVAPGAKGQPHRLIENAGHFLQEDAGEEIAGELLRWMGKAG